MYLFLVSFIPAGATDRLRTSMNLLESSPSLTEVLTAYPTE